MFVKLPTVHGERCASIFSNGKGFDAQYPLETKAMHLDVMMQFIHDISVPQTLITDNAREMLRGRSRKIANEYHIKQKHIVPYSHWWNLAELAI